MCYDQDMGWGVATLDDVVVLWWWELYWCCVRSWGKIQMVHWNMENGSRVGDKLYIKRCCLLLEDFLFFSLYSWSGIAKQVTTLKQVQLLFLPASRETNIEPVALFSVITFCYQSHIHTTPPITLEWVPLYWTWYGMYVDPSTGCTYYSEPCSQFCWIYLAPNHRWIHICNDCVDKSLQLTRFDIHQYHYWSPYRNARIRQ